MILDRLELFNFKSYGHQDLELAPGMNLVTGRNAQGKTNLLEAIYFVSHLKSNRTPRLRELIREGEENASVRVLIMDEGTKATISIAFGVSGKSVEVNGRKMQASRALGLLKCVMFEPGDLYLVKGEPSRRREFLDETLEELGQHAARPVEAYKRVLRQRNALLKRWEDYGAGFRAALEPWSEKLAEEGGVLAVARERMTESMSRMINETHSEISGQDVKIGFEYRGTFGLGAASPEEAASRMRGELARRIADEKRARSTLVGPHRDDVEIRIGGREARYTASQGEQRTLAFAMRLAQRGYVSDETGKEPILLLDDVLSELDEERRARVLGVVGRSGQSIVTATEPPEAGGVPASRILVVEGGTVRVG